MADTGWVSAGTYADLKGVGGAPCDGSPIRFWTNPMNAAVQNDTYATYSLPKSTVSNCLSATNFAFGIPAGSTIDGIEVRYDGYEPMLIESNLYLHKAGVLAGANRFAGAITQVTDTDTYRVYGGAADMWGTGYGLADVTHATFGCAMQFSNPDLADHTMHVDHLQIKIYYSLPPGYGNDVNDVASANIGSVNDVPTANINTVNDI